MPSDFPIRSAPTEIQRLRAELAAVRMWSLYLAEGPAAGRQISRMELSMILDNLAATATH